MYHISEDKRAVKSAQLIWEGLEKCLQEKALATVRVSDINEKSFVSRATFYRLFDSVQDVLVYECDCIFTELTLELSKGSFSSNKELFLFIGGDAITRELRGIAIGGRQNTGGEYLKAFDFMSGLFDRCIENPLMIDAWGELTAETVSRF